ncbi:MAG: hypothetical protein ACHQJ7_00820 [Vicinamibacteria bacterium]
MATPHALTRGILSARGTLLRGSSSAPMSYVAVPTMAGTVVIGGDTPSSSQPMRSFWCAL